MREVEAVGLVLSDAPHLDELIEVALPDLLARPNGLVHLRLRESRFVGFVVAAQSVAVHVDHDIAVELLPEIHRQPNDLSHRLGVFSIHMEDRNLKHLRHVAGVGCRATLRRTGGEADLVVHDDVNRAADARRLKLVEVERLLNDPLARKCRVAVNQQTHDPAAIHVLLAILLGSHAAHHHGIHEFEMTRVEAK